MYENVNHSLLIGLSQMFFIGRTTFSLNHNRILNVDLWGFPFLGRIETTCLLHRDTWYFRF